jgi:hypothetical protein
MIQVRTAEGDASGLRHGQINAAADAVVGKGARWSLRK